MKINSFFFQWILVGSIGLSPFAQAASTPKQVIQNGAEQVRKLLQQKAKKGSKQAELQKQKLKAIVDDFLDYRELSKRALGKHWNDRTPAAQEEFVGLLRDLIEASYTSPISDNIDFQMEYEDEEINEDEGKASVSAVASAKTKKGKTVSEDLNFKLYLNKNAWMIYDVEFGDISLVRHYRGEFNRKIEKESYEALLFSMRKKLEEIKTGKLEKQPKL